MSNSNVKECSIFPNGDTIRNDRLVEILEVIYDLTETYDGQAVLYLLLFKIRYGSFSPKYPRRRKVKIYREFIVNELGFLTKKGTFPKDVRNCLVYIDETNSLFEKLHFKLLEGRKTSFKLILALDQYDPKKKKVYPSKNSWKATTDADYRKKLGESNWKFLTELDSDGL